jgi:hypothetical protein
VLISKFAGYSYKENKFVSIFGILLDNKDLKTLQRAFIRMLME